MLDPPVFVPLRTDPPPELASTLWIRSALALSILATAIVVLLVELVGRSGRVFTETAIVIPHAAVVVLLVVWSGRAMANADAITPSTKYSAGPSGRLAGAMWVTGFVAPLFAVVVVGRIGSEFADVEAAAPTIATIAVVVVALLTAWLPFQYHRRQAVRIGAPVSIMMLWFWAPLMTFVVGLSVLAYVYRGRIAGEGFERSIGVGGVYGLAAAVFAWSTWRAIAVFDEVIDLRWRRWKSDWEQTLADLIAQPTPPPDR